MLQKILIQMMCLIVSSNAQVKLQLQLAGLQLKLQLDSVFKVNSPMQVCLKTNSLFTVKLSLFFL